MVDLYANLWDFCEKHAISTLFLQTKRPNTMGCEACKGEKAYEECKQRKGAVEQYREEMAKDHECNLKLNQGNYVMLTVGRLADHYEVLEKLGEGIDPM